MDYLLAADSYDTPGDRRDLCTRLCGNSRLNFFLRVCWNYYRIGRCAKQGRFDRKQQIHYCERNLRLLEHCGARLHLRGLDFLAAEPGPFVLAGNHMSAVETMILNAAVSPRFDFTFVIKNGLFSVPFLRQAMRSIDAIGVSQTNPREDFKTVLEQGKRRLTRGCSVLVFPEGARQSEFDPEQFNTIAVKLARAAGVKVIPFALKTDFLSPGRLFREYGPIHPERHIHLEFGAPLEVSGNGREAQTRLIRFIAERALLWGLPQREPLPPISQAAAAKLTP